MRGESASLWLKPKRSHGAFKPALQLDKPPGFAAETYPEDFGVTRGREASGFSEFEGQSAGLLAGLGDSLLDLFDFIDLDVAEELECQVEILVRYPAHVIERVRSKLALDVGDDLSSGIGQLNGDKKTPCLRCR